MAYIVRRETPNKNRRQLSGPRDLVSPYREPVPLGRSDAIKEMQDKFVNRPSYIAHMEGHRDVHVGKHMTPYSFPSTQHLFKGEIVDNVTNCRKRLKPLDGPPAERLTERVFHLPAELAPSRMSALSAFESAPNNFPGSRSVEKKHGVKLIPLSGKSDENWVLGLKGVGNYRPYLGTRVARLD